MFYVSTQVFIELSLQFPQFLLSFPHIFLQLQTRLSGVIVTSSQSTTVTHLVTYKSPHNVKLHSEKHCI